MGDPLTSGFEEVDGVRLGYLVIRGKQMFALSQVFTNLLKNIPRTTVHKRMDHLKVQKHHCDLDELRRLKAINSVAFHAAKCTLISREDVEALYTSCKAERGPRGARRGGRAPAGLGARGGPPPEPPYAALWEGGGKLWLGWNGAAAAPLSSSSSSSKRKGWRAAAAAAAASGAAFLPASDLPHFWRPPRGRSALELARSPGKGSANFETRPAAPPYVALAPGSGGFRGLLCAKHPPCCFHRASAAALAARPKLALAAAAAANPSRSCPEALGCRPKRKRAAAAAAQGRFPGACERRLLLVPGAGKAAKAAAEPRLPGFEGFLAPTTLPFPDDACSSDSESSSYSDRAANDSDFCSSLSSSSNSGSSEEEEDDEEDEEGSGASDSSELSSDEEDEEEDDEESSSESDSSSGSSQASVQSIRFRRTSFCKPLGAVAPGSLAAPSPGLQQASPPLPGPATPGIKAEAAEAPQEWSISRSSRAPKVEPDLDYCTPQPAELGCGSPPPELKASPCLARGCAPSPGPKTSSAWPLQRTLREGRGGRGPAAPPPSPPGTPAASPPAAPLQPSAQHPADIMGGLSNPQPHRPVAPCPGCSSFRSQFEVTPGVAAAAAPERPDHLPGPVQPLPLLPIAQIKVEDSSANAEYGAFPGHGQSPSPLKCESSPGEPKLEADGRPSPAPSPGRPQDLLLPSKEDPASTDEPPSPPLSPSTPPGLPSQAPAPCTLGIAAAAAKPEDGEYKFGARVRKNYRTLVLGKRALLPSPAPLKPNLKSVRSPRLPPGKLLESHEGPLDDLTPLGRRRRVAGQVASSVKRPFSFMGNFPCPPSLVVGLDGDLLPAYTLNTAKDAQPPPKTHPVWKWQLGGSAIPLPPSHKFRKFHS